MIINDKNGIMIGVISANNISIAGTHIMKDLKCVPVTEDDIEVTLTLTRKEKTHEEVSIYLFKKLK